MARPPIGSATLAEPLEPVVVLDAERAVAVGGGEGEGPTGLGKGPGGQGEVVVHGPGGLAQDGPAGLREVPACSEVNDPAGRVNRSVTTQSA